MPTAALAAEERARAATLGPVLARPDPADLARMLQARCCFLDHPVGFDGLAFVALDLRRSALWYREALALMGTAAQATERPWELADVCEDAARKQLVERLVEEAMEPSIRLSGRLRQATGQERERLKRSIINPAPAAVRVQDLGLARYLRHSRASIRR